LQPSDLVLHVLDLILDAPHLLGDLLGPLAVARLSGLLECGLELAQLLMQPGQLVPKFTELSAVGVVLPLCGLSRPRGLTGPCPLR
jgi:hypothetical protein